jgi:hypothetical protein
VLDAHPETAICGHHTIRHDEGGAKPDEVMGFPPGFYDLEAFLPLCFLHTNSVLFRRVVEGLPAWSSCLIMGDVPLFVEIARHGNICLLEECMAVYRVHGGGIWNGLDETQRCRGHVALYQALHDNLDQKYHPAIRIRLRRAFFNIGLAQFEAGRPDGTRQALREYCGLCEPFEFLSQKALLALKGYGWWAYPLWRQARRLVHHGRVSGVQPPLTTAWPAGEATQFRGFASGMLASRRHRFSGVSGMRKKPSSPSMSSARSKGRKKRWTACQVT